MSRRKFLGIIGGAAVVAAVGLTSYEVFLRPSAPKQIRQVTPDLGFNDTFPGTVIIAAGIAQGFFQDEGFKLDPIFSPNGLTAVQGLASGKSQFINVDLSQIIVTRSQGAPVKAISILYHHSPFAIITTKPLNSLKDLAGKTLGSFPGNSALLLFPALAQYVGFDASSVKVSSMPFSAMFPALINGQVDFLTAFGYNGVTQTIDTGTKFYSYNYADYGDFGYATTLATTESMISDSPNLIRSYVRAYWKSAHWAASNPSDAINALLQQHPELKHDDMLAQWNYAAQNQIFAGDAKGTDGVASGMANEQEVATTLSLVKNYLSSPQTPISSFIAPRDLYTNQFLT